METKVCNACGHPFDDLVRGLGRREYLRSHFLSPSLREPNITSSACR